MKVIRLVIRIALIYVQIPRHGDIMFEHKSKQDMYIYIYIYRERERERERERHDVVVLCTKISIINKPFAIG
jgi:hypothetical protein